MKPFFALMSLFVIANANGQQFNSDFQTIAVNKKVKEFPDKFDLSSPLNSFITLRYVLMNGKDGLLRNICSAGKRSLLPDSTAPDSDVPEDVRQLYLNTTIQEIIMYKDSVAFVISQMFPEKGAAFYSVRNFHPEQGKWVNNGEDLFQDMESVNQYVRNRAEFFYKEFRSIQKKLLYGY
jgi:hypothetical protein